LKAAKPSVGLKAVLDLRVAESLHPELSALAGVPQEPEWHPEGDVWTHTLMVADCAAEIVGREKLEGDPAYTVMLGALCHDFGKPATTARDPEDGRIRSQGHSEEGVRAASAFLKRLKVSEEIEKKVKNIVLEHLNPLFLYNHRDEIKPSTVKRLSVRLFPASFDELIFVAEADYKGRTLPGLEDYPAGKWLREQLEILELKSGGPAPILMGRHLLERGWSPGPGMGKVLKAVFEMQIEGAVSDLDAAFEQAEKLRDKST
jgi:tRNA nucleotidyltransferase (CCA-adding enzyme)